MQVTGTMTGDNECWCMQVTEAEYRKICGEETWKNEKKWRDELEKEPFSGPSDVWLLYPGDIMRALGVENLMRVTLEIKLQEHHFACGCHGDINKAYIAYGPESHRRLDYAFYCYDHAPMGAIPYKTSGEHYEEGSLDS